MLVVTKAKHQLMLIATFDVFQNTLIQGAGSRMLYSGVGKDRICPHHLSSMIFCNISLNGSTLATAADCDCPWTDKALIPCWSLNLLSHPVTALKEVIRVIGVDEWIKLQCISNGPLIGVPLQCC